MADEGRWFPSASFRVGFCFGVWSLPRSSSSWCSTPSTSTPRERSKSWTRRVMLLLRNSSNPKVARILFQRNWETFEMNNCLAKVAPVGPGVREPTHGKFRLGFKYFITRNPIVLQNYLLHLSIVKSVLSENQLSKVLEILTRSKKMRFYIFLDTVRMLTLQTAFCFNFFQSGQNILNLPRRFSSCLTQRKDRTFRGTFFPTTRRSGFGNPTVSNWFPSSMLPWT